MSIRPSGPQPAFPPRPLPLDREPHGKPAVKQSLLESARKQQAEAQGALGESERIAKLFEKMRRDAVSPPPPPPPSSRR
jgi:hypothetical protein